VIEAGPIEEGDALFRIYRDTRFPQDTAAPYKTNFSCGDSRNVASVVGGLEPGYFLKSTTRAPAGRGGGHLQPRPGDPDEHPGAYIRPSGRADMRVRSITPRLRQRPTAADGRGDAAWSDRPRVVFLPPNCRIIDLRSSSVLLRPGRMGSTGSSARQKTWTGMSQGIRRNLAAFMQWLRGSPRGRRRHERRSTRSYPPGC